MADLTQTRLQELLRYEPDTGLFWWRVQRAGRGSIAAPAGSTREGGYRVVCVDRRLYRLHRLAWLYMTGVWPTHTIDHVNGDPSDNRWQNLRDVPIALNCQNARRPTGIEHRPGLPRPFRASITVNGKKVNVGSFPTREEAAAARAAAKAAMHPGYLRSEILPR